MNIFLHELRYYRKSTIIWTCSLIAMVLVFMNIFPSFGLEAGKMNEVFAGFPEEFITAFGLKDMDLSTVLGFYGFCFVFISVAASVQAMNIGTAILSAETRDKTADFLLSKPISRNQIITSKLLAAFASIVITNIIFSLASFVVMESVKKYEYNMKAFLLITLTMFLLQIFFIALGILISTVMKKIKSVLPISLGAVFAFYIINMFGDMVNDDKFKYFTPFGFFDTNSIMENSQYEAKFVILWAILIVVFIASSYVIYNKKDVQGV